jgi:septal ring factor EnvC (AmiA/AmiB activator)
MDLFGKRRIAELQEDLAQKDDEYTKLVMNQKELAGELRAAKNQVEYLVRTIRDMDQEIYNMGQKDNWPAQRPHFAKLHDEMAARKVAESKRIGDILRPEILKTYADPLRKNLLGNK